MNRTINVCFVVCCLLLLCGIAAAQSGEPARVNQAVQVPMLKMDADGTIVGPAVPFEDIKDLEIAVMPDPQISYAVLDKALKELQSRGASHLHVISLGYVFTSGQLFYRPDSSLSRIGINVQPPELDINLNSLAAKAAASGVAMPKPISTPFGVIAGLNYLVGINAAGEILFVERQARTPDLPEIESALRQAHVKKLAYLDGKEVPAAIMVSIPVQ